MTYCSICRKDLLKGQRLAVLALPVECTNNGGDYSFLGDFTQNEQVMHLECYQKGKSVTSYVEPQEMPTLYVPTFPVQTKTPKFQKSQIACDLKEVLAEVGEKVTFSDIFSFLEANPGLVDTESLLNRWFESRNRL